MLIVATFGDRELSKAADCSEYEGNGKESDGLPSAQQPTVEARRETRQHIVRSFPRREQAQVPYEVRRPQGRGKLRGETLYRTRVDRPGLAIGSPDETSRRESEDRADLCIR